ncbi:hypothetical protein QF030_001459 [Streptomyces rishiriensis]|uniref:Uncharacterized protein n=1 Tax=Streptomyces rishiriensis TaxID=68264 RepID=A0ABU0NJK1_STRRH|nr:hypothetical protein [Streptomyces rishiriensis]
MKVIDGPSGPRGRGGAYFQGSTADHLARRTSGAPDGV